jgi:5-oxoprolinase (ATP-hydrolysing) subunit A
MSEHAEPSRAMDLNADVGERPRALRDGSEEALLQVVTSANVACGGHAGDAETMAATLSLAVRLGVAAGAHPGYPDRAGFGRASLGMGPGEIEASVFEQVHALAEVAAWAGCTLGHVKPHGALYNDAARDPAVAAAIARGVARWSRDVVLVGLAGSAMLRVFASHGFAVAAEGFADRAYERDGSLRARTLPGAVIAVPGRAAAQALRIAREGVATGFDGRDVPVRARTLCVHSDTPGAAGIASAVRDALVGAGIRVEPLRPR